MRLALTFVAILCALSPALADDPLARQPYLGLSVRDSADGPIVGWISPGPLGGTGFASRAGILRSDNLVSLDGTPIESAEHFTRLLNALEPRATVTLVLRRAPDADPRGAVPKGGAGGEERACTIALADRLSWSGTVGRGLGTRTIGQARPGEFESMILQHAGELDVLDAHGGLAALIAHLQDVQQRNLDLNSLPAIVRMFERPLSLDAVEQEIAALVMHQSAGFTSSSAVGRSALRADAVGSSALRADLAPGAAWPWNLIAGVLDLPGITAEQDEDEHAKSLRLILELQRTWREPAEQLVETMRRGVYLHDEHAEQSLALIRESPKLVEQILPTVAREGRAHWARMHRMVDDFRGRPVLSDVPDDVRAAVQGDILHAQLMQLPGHDAGAWLVVGGEGPNTYDTSKIAFIIDMGGDDQYRYSRARHLAQVIIDLGGDDLHKSLTDFAGAATALFGVSILDSRAGNDTFRSGGEHAERGTHATIGAGIFGLGLLINRAGDDQYLNLGPGSGWSTGIGFYGAGLVIDLDGDDTFHAEILSQGVGGPRGFGAIIDARGNDSYKANGPNFPSAYGTPDVFLSRSQGFGYGIRSYAGGGVGAIYDLDGDDRYEAGEFAQAGAYYFGLGIMRDRRGNDTYIGNRYGQAFAAHQAGGILIDEEGDDTYQSMTAASQSGAWDQCITMLIDRSGNDTYKADGLAQGAAAMQALAILIDLEGNDSYEGRGSAIQGHSSNDTYHYHTARVFSFSALLDLGGGNDTYSSGRENNTRQATGHLRDDAPAESTLHGIFVDD